MPRQKRDPIACLFNVRKKVAPDQYGKVAPVKKNACWNSLFPGGFRVMAHTSKGNVTLRSPSQLFFLC